MNHTIGCKKTRIEMRTVKSVLKANTKIEISVSTFFL